MDESAKNYFLKVAEQNAQNYVANYGDKLCHYTSLETCQKILETKELWLGNTKDMNDSSEIKHFVIQLKDAIEEDSDISRTRIDSFFSAILKRIDNEYPYALCLSRRYDDAAQWERYGNNAKGCCLVFNTRNFVLATNLAPSMLNEVFYEYDVRKHKHYQVITDYLKTGNLGSFSNETGLMDNILVCSYFRKHHSFSSEQEIRWTNLWRRPIERSTIKTNRTPSGTFRRYMIVSLEHLCNTYNVDFESLFSGILLGPLTKQEQVTSFKNTMINLGYSKLAQIVCHSDCPLKEKPIV